VPTPASRHFIPVDEIRKVEGADVFLDEEEWASWKHLKDPVLHIEVQQPATSPLWSCTLRRQLTRTTTRSCGDGPT